MAVLRPWEDRPALQRRPCSIVAWRSQGSCWSTWDKRPATDLKTRAVPILQLRDGQPDEAGAVGQLYDGFLGAIDAKRGAAGEQPWRGCSRRNSEPQQTTRATHGATRTARIGT